jgi:hypothetical protein
MLAIFLTLMRTVSLSLHGTMDVIVHNQHRKIELVSPVYFCNHGTYNEYSVERTDTGTMMKISFRFDLHQDESSGILMYEVRRNRSTKFDHQPGTNITYAKIIEDTFKMGLLLVAWRIDRSWKYRIYTMLVEFDNELVLSEDKLAKLYDKIYDIPTNAYNSFFKHGGTYKST